jgi:hypothetical protein
MTATTLENPKPTSAGTDRKAEILATIEQFQAEREAYIASPGTEDTPPGSELFKSAAAIVHAFARDGVPYELQGAVAPAEALGGWLVRLAEDPLTDFTSQPGDALWGKVDSIISAIESSKQPTQKLESIKTLNEQKVPVWQIAKIYGDSEQNIQAQIDNPTEDYVAPIFGRWQAEQNQAAKTWSVGALLSGLSNKLKAFEL